MPTVGDIMTRNPVCCTPTMRLADAANLMREGDFGLIPVVDSLESKRLVGVLTDRDIVVRAVAEGHDPRTASARDFMSREVRVLAPDAGLDECRRLLEGSQVRRVPVVDAAGAIIGIVALADLSSEIATDQLGATLEQISGPDTRQLYSEVMEGNASAGTVTSVDDPATSHPVKARAA